MFAEPVQQGDYDRVAAAVVAIENSASHDITAISPVLHSSPEKPVSRKDSVLRERISRCKGGRFSAVGRRVSNNTYRMHNNADIAPAQDRQYLATATHCSPAIPPFRTPSR